MASAEELQLYNDIAQRLDAPCPDCGGSGQRQIQLQADDGSPDGISEVAVVLCDTCHEGRVRPLMHPCLVHVTARAMTTWKDHSTCERCHGTYVYPRMDLRDGVPVVPLELVLEAAKVAGLEPDLEWVAHSTHDGGQWEYAWESWGAGPDRGKPHRAPTPILALLLALDAALKAQEADRA